MNASLVDLSSMRVLHIEDNEGDAILFRESWRRIAKNAVNLVYVESLSKAFDQLSTNNFDIVFLDLWLDDSQGIITLDRYLERSPRIPCIVLIDIEDASIQKDTIMRGAHDYIIKDSVTTELLAKSVQNAIFRHRALLEIRENKNRIEEMMHATNSGVIILNEQLESTFVNSAMNKLLQIEDANIKNSNLLSHFSGEIVTHINNGISNFKELNEIEATSKGGRSFIFLQDGSNIPIDFKITYWIEENRIMTGLYLRELSTEETIEKLQKENIAIHYVISHILQIGLLSLSIAEKLEKISYEIMGFMNKYICPVSEAFFYINNRNEVNQLQSDKNFSLSLINECENNGFESIADSSLEFASTKRLSNRFYLIRLKLGKKSDLYFVIKTSNDYLISFNVKPIELIQFFESVRLVILNDGNKSKLLQFRRVIEQSPTAVIITNNKGDIEYLNDATVELTGYDRHEVLGSNVAMFQSKLTSNALYQTLWETITSGRTWRGEIRNRRKSGDIYWEYEIISPVKDANGQITHYVVLKQDIDFQKREESRRADHNAPDFVTKLPSQALTLDRLAQCIKRMKAQSSQVGVALIELEHLSDLNKKYSVQFSDNLLKQVADLLSDEIENAGTVGRVGIGEYLLIWNEHISLEDLYKKIRIIRKLLSKPFYVQGKSRKFEFSGVFDSVDPVNTNTDNLFTSLKNALVLVQKNGEGQFLSFSEMKENFDQEEESKLDISRALANNEFELYFQGQISTKTGDLIGAEALIRWNHPVVGLIPPIQFIPKAEESDEIVSIGNWVIDETCRYIHNWIKEGKEPPRLSINISAKQLLNNSLIVQITESISHWNVPARLLEIELTETQMMSNPELAIETLLKLQKMGISIAGDDFGTGYSSLSYLKKIPMNRLKIDRSFVDDITIDSGSKAIAEMIINLGHTLGLLVLAEGVENSAQLQLLQRLNCDEFQGYYFSKPVPAVEFEKQMEHRKSAVKFKSESLDSVLLVIDDEMPILNSLKRLLRNESYRIKVANTTSEALDILASERVQVILSEQKMPDMSGTEFFEKMKFMYPDTIRMILSGFTDLDTVVDAVNRGSVFKFLTKPWDDQVLKKDIYEAFADYKKRSQT